MLKEKASVIPPVPGGVSPDDHYDVDEKHRVISEDGGKSDLIADQFLDLTEWHIRGTITRS